jgi:RHS repeat-associated protein
MFFALPNWLKHASTPRRQHRGRQGHRRLRWIPYLEKLEDCQLLAAFTVINTNDSGPGSLRQAILDANALGGTNTINFQIADSLQTIRPTSALPALDSPVFIDGTPPTSLPHQIIQLNGANAGTATGLQLDAGHSTVRGLVINGFHGDGILLTTLGGDLIVGNRIGTDAGGTAAVPNAGNGIEVRGVNDTDNLIGGTTLADRNVISGNGVGITLGGGTADNLIEGNYIGTNATGTQAVGNKSGGGVIDADANTLGSALAGAGNVISGNKKDGVAISGNSNIIEGNRIGIDVTQRAALGNNGDGVLLSAGSGNTLGGTTAGAGNAILANHRYGVEIKADHNVVQGNYIGTDSDGADNMGNLADDDGTGGIGTHLEEYTYLGLSTVVRRAHPESGVDLSYINQPGGSTDGGDQYTGLNRFGRVIDQYWAPSAGGSPTDRFQYTYDRDGNRLSRNNRVNPTFNEQYGYDSFNQLTSFIRGSHAQNWQLDPLGNWVSFTNDGTTQSRSHNTQNQITSLSPGTTPAYDSNGNTTLDDKGTGYTYDAWNRIVKVNVLPPTTPVAYDALGRRIQDDAGVQLYYSSAWQVVEEQVGGVMQTQYVWSPMYVDALVERDSKGGPRLYVQQDANWNVTAVVDTTGTVRERYAYDPYGAPTVLDPMTWTPITSQFNWIYLHQGGRYDGLTGLYNFRNRDFSPTLGRWMQQDPAGYDDGTNLYQYVHSDPTTAVDPYGLGSLFDWAKNFALMSGGVSKTIWLSVPIGPTGVTVNVDVTFAAELHRCTDKNGAEKWYVAGTFTLEGYIAWGRSFKTHPKPPRGKRNEKIPNPNARVPRLGGIKKDPIPLKDPGMIKRKKLAGQRLPPQSGYRERNLYFNLDDPADCDCPKEWFVVTGQVFIRGSIGYGVGVQLSASQPLTRNFDLVRGWTFEGSVAWGVYGASIEAGIGGTVGFIFYL